MLDNIHIKALEACVEVADPGDEAEGPVSDETLNQPFEQWSPDRICTVARTAISILKRMKATGQLDLPST